MSSFQNSRLLGIGGTGALGNGHRPRSGKDRVLHVGDMTRIGCLKTLPGGRWRLPPSHVPPSRTVRYWKMPAIFRRPAPEGMEPQSVQALRFRPWRITPRAEL